MRYLQVLRDEVHNFAIRSHRNKRSKALRASHLDSLPGVGSKRKKALLHYFGSYEQIENATAEELSKIEGISKSIAKNIYEALHNRN
jgi:excinuclease ABC subunit C